MTETSDTAHLLHRIEFQGINGKRVPKSDY